MKRLKIFFILCALIISILLCLFTLKFTLIHGFNLLFLLFPYFGTTLAVFISIFNFIKEKSKANKFALLAATYTWLAILSFVIAGFGIINDMIKLFAYIIFIITFVMLIFFYGYWIKYDKWINNNYPTINNCRIIILFLSLHYHISKVLNNLFPSKLTIIPYFLIK